MVDTEEAARILGLSPGTLRNWRVKRKNLRFVVLSDGRSVRYLKEDVMNLAQERARVALKVEVDHDN